MTRQDDAAAIVRHAVLMHMSRLWRFGLFLSGRRDLAEELVQATCRLALGNRERIGSAFPMSVTLLALLRSIWLNENRPAGFERQWSAADVEREMFAQVAATTDMPGCLRSAIGAMLALPEAQREALFLVLVEDMTYREAAHLLAVSTTTVTRLVLAARIALGKTHHEPA